MAKKKPAAKQPANKPSDDTPKAFEFEAVGADAYAGPDNCYSEVHCNRNAIFYRINGGPWLRANDKHQSLSKASRVAGRCKTEDEVHVTVGCVGKEGAPED